MSGEELGTRGSEAQLARAIWKPLRSLGTCFLTYETRAAGSVISLRHAGTAVSLSSNPGASAPLLGDLERIAQIFHASFPLAVKWD